MEDQFLDIFNTGYEGAGDLKRFIMRDGNLNEEEFMP
jgi:hypothetical protein